MSLPKVAFNETPPPGELAEAARKGDTALMRILLQCGSSPDEKDQNGNTPMIYMTHDADVVRLLVEHRATIDERGKLGRTALYWAVQGQHMEAIRLLLQKGAAIDAKDELGATPLSLAENFNYTEIAQTLVAAAEMKVREQVGLRQRRLKQARTAPAVRFKK